MKGRGKVRKDHCLYISYSTEAIFLCLWLYLVFLGIMAETRTRNDISAKYIQTLVDQPMTLESAEDLERVLMEPLPGTIFVHPGTFPAAVSRAILPLEEVRSDASEDTYKLSTLIYSGFDRPQISGSEETMASDADYLTTELWFRLHPFIHGFRLQMAKQTADGQKPYRSIRGDPNEPSARLLPVGKWCIDSQRRAQAHRSRFISSDFRVIVEDEWMESSCSSWTTLASLLCSWRETRPVLCYYTADD